MKEKISVAFTICSFTFMVLSCYSAWLRRSKCHVNAFKYLFYTVLSLLKKKKSRCAQIHNASQVAVILYFFSMETLMPKLRVHQEIVFKLATSMSMNI